MKTNCLAALVLLVIFRSCDTPPAAGSQQEGYELRTVAFYNVENLFDTVNDSLVEDDSRTPEGRDRWTGERYRHKLRNIARVLAGMGVGDSAAPPDLIGLCEVENRQVVTDLISQKGLREHAFGVVHFDSPDPRGIDVALLYKKAYFTVAEQQSRRLLLRTPDNHRKYTRDQLVVYGYLDGEPLYISVNHWPSRSGGQAVSEPFRRQAAALQRNVCDSVLRLDPGAKFISMGDYNDEPTDVSLRYGLGAGPYTDSLPAFSFYNPMLELFRSGIGSLAYRDRWSLFDQMLFNGNWIVGNEGYRLKSVGVYNAEFLRVKEGPYRGYPFRTYAGGTYQGGFSDHFPVYAVLARPVVAAP